MLTLTESARTAVADLAEQAGVAPEGGLRIAESPATEGSLELTLVATPQPDDQVVDDQDAHVFVAATTAPVLTNLTLDTDPAQPGPAFVLAPQR
ncbi:Fe-S cluster assembly protein HesB [Luteimicrobium subarcticum]|uniref:Fe-S cluster assembly iron-binding protein IscA n=1 Tax=Luteimicrobium subarcticum TaxID=620910 RepID=A0A2M8WSD0_9MICO|nr:Fe-S cluster assembly protein HesB [Luteimicrobium subarcticum]PJI93855.1 Fe-S cluster assembly iron-binding protein IscA [Luteimicrobium subarcticum]